MKILHKERAFFLMQVTENKRAAQYRGHLKLAKIRRWARYQPGGNSRSADGPKFGEPDVLA